MYRLKKRYFQLVEIVFCPLLLFIFFGLPYFFHEVTLAIAMQPWTVTVLTKMIRDILVVNIKTHGYSQPGKVR